MIHSQVVITGYENKICSFLIKDNQLEDLHVFDTDSLLNHIYIGKVKNISKNIDAAFVEVSPGNMGFLSLKNNDLAIKEGDEILVQVIKEGIKTKDPVLTTDLSLQGKYSVVSYKKNKKGTLQFSKKLNEMTKKCLSEVFKDITLAYDVIIRTAAQDVNDHTTIIEEIDTLGREMEHILTFSSMRTCFSRVYESRPEYVDYLFKLQPDSYEEIVTDVAEVFDTLKENQFPVRKYEDSYSLKKLYSLDHKIEELLGKKVYLKSGATLFIEPTEALTVIDVNTGKCVINKEKEDLILKINLEAAEEIAKQIRLRNISGIIIIDFINMEDKEHEEILIKQMKQLIKKDPVLCSYIDITKLGLMELTRKKVQRPLCELFHQ